MPTPHPVRRNYAALEAFWPPSVNHYWLARGRARYLSPAAREWQAAFVVEWVRAGRPRIQGPCHITVEATPPDRRRRDLDNVLKAILDGLVQAGAIPDDSMRYIRELHLRALDPKKPGRVLILVQEICKPSNESYKS